MMAQSFQRTIYGVSTAVSLALAASAALADPPLPGLTNLNFDSYTGSSPKNYFGSVDPVGWTGGSGLIFIDSTTIPNAQAASPVYLTTYANPVGSYSGNYVEADGNPYYESGFNYTVTGLKVGETYTLSFYQGASQQTGFDGLTTNQWIVALGTAGLSRTLYTGYALYSDADPSASIAASPLMTIPSGTAVGWDYVSVNLTADATTDILSFLAWGDNGNTANLPPIAFLAGVNSPPGLGVGSVPEPASMALFAVGLLGLGGIARRRRRKHSLPG